LGDMGVDYWDAAIWKQEMEKHEVRFSHSQDSFSFLRICFA